MIERVARTIAATSDGPWDDPYWQQRYRKQARTAIEAMREPTETMLETLDECVCEWQPSYQDGGHAEAWRAVIDAALK